MSVCCPCAYACVCMSVYLCFQVHFVAIQVDGVTVPAGDLHLRVSPMVGFIATVMMMMMMK